MKQAWRWLMAAAALVVAAIGLARLDFEVEVLKLLPDELPAVRGLVLHQKYFTGQDELIITVKGAEASETEAAVQQSVQSLRRRPDLVANVHHQAPGEGDPAAAAELLACLWLNQPPPTMATLAERLDPTHLPAWLADERERLATSLSPADLGMLGYDPFGLTRFSATNDNALAAISQSSRGFSSPDGRFRLVLAQPRQPLRGFMDHQEWIRAIREVCGQAGLGSGISLGFTGAPAFVAEISRGMRRDMTVSAAGTLLLILALFWWMHRSWLPLLGLCLALGLIGLATLAVGGLALGKLNVISAGFAAILLGLVADYALLYYQELKARPDLSAAELRALLAPGVWWSAATTAAAFSLLAWAGLPGLRQLGLLVAVGVLLAAGVVQYLLVPLLRRWTRTGPDAGNAGLQQAGHPSSKPGARRSPLAITLLLLVCGLVSLGLCPPEVDQSNKPLQPVDSPAEAALAELQQQLNQAGEPWFVLVAGANETEVAGRLNKVEEQLRQAKEHGWIASYELPAGLWPHPAWQSANRPIAARLAARGDSLRAAALAEGFTTNALVLADGVLSCWAASGSTSGVVWPVHPANQWLLGRIAARTDQGWLVRGIIHAPANIDVGGWLGAMRARLESDDILLAGWPALGKELIQYVEPRVFRLTAALAVLILGCLLLAFRRWTEVLLCLASVSLSFLALLVLMALAGWKWNLMNLTALPLMLGAGVDYAIHVQMALRRHAGDAGAMRRVTGKAIFLCAATSVAGFGSLSWSGNAGLASLGQVCASGMACAAFVSLCLLPAWWSLLHSRRAS